MGFRVRAWVVGCLLSVGGCDCSPSGEPGGCSISSDCEGSDVCIDGSCVPISMSDAGPSDSSTMSCEDDRPVCGFGSGAICCMASEECVGNLCVPDCGEDPLCGDECCGEAEVCVADRCVADCEDETLRCGVDDDICCNDGEACIGDSCVPLGAECVFTEECEIEDICLASVGRCVPRDSVEVCEFIPEPGDFAPQVGCRWVPAAADPFVAWDDVVMTPAVANLTDDNGDGETNELDTPDIIFVSSDHQNNGCCSYKGVLRIVSGNCEEDGTMRTIASLAEPFMDVSGGVAVGNLHPDDMAEERPPEIVAFLGGGGITLPDETVEPRPFIGAVAFRRTSDDGSSWEELWRNTTIPSLDHALAAAQPSIADLDGNGAPEVVIGNVVLNGMTGQVVWDGRITVGPDAGMGHNAFLGPTSTIADIDRDGTMEVIAGNTVYNGPDGVEEWTFDFTSSNSNCASRYSCDGYNAIGNFDDDEFGEVVAVRVGQVYVWEHDGTLKHLVDIPWEDCGQQRDPARVDNESGPPTVADFDGDGRAEIGTASADFYVVVDFDCTGDPLPAECDSENILWKVPNQDCSSRATGSSVFDFEGDGRAEVVYADERNFRIFDGLTGAILFDDDTHSSNTRMEMPIVVDVDNDGKAEVIVPEPNGNADLGGIEVWEDSDNNWVRTRRIWNQHTYHVTNITEDGQVPRNEPENWLNSRLNNFRQNVQPGGLFDATDLVVVSIELIECEVDTLTIRVRVGNRGAIGAAPGVPVHVVIQPEGADPIDLGFVRTTTNILPGQEEAIEVSYTEEGGITFQMFTVSATVDSDGMGGSVYNECDEDNNETQSESLRSCTIL